MNYLVPHKRMFVCFLVVVILFSFSTSVFASDSIKYQEKEYVFNTPYTYPILPGTDEWKEFNTHDEKLEACQIPEEILQNMTIEALVETVLNYPLMGDMLAYNTPIIGFNAVSSTFNGLQELTKRPNAKLELEKYLDKVNSKSAQSLTLTETECTLVPIYLNVVNNCISGQNAYSNSASITRGSSVMLRTPMGTSFYAVFDQTWDDLGFMSEYYAEQQDTYYRTVYPNAVKLGSCSPKYNCHSYAWYTPSTSNLHWIASPGPYMADGSYSQISAPTVGCKVYYSSGDHSGIVVTTNWGAANRIGVRSKWGALGLYEHYIYDCPYNYSSISYWQ